MKTSENHEIKLSRISPQNREKYLCVKYMAYTVIPVFIVVYTFIIKSPYFQCTNVKYNT